MRTNAGLPGVSSPWFKCKECRGLFKLAQLRPSPPPADLTVLLFRIGTLVAGTCPKCGGDCSEDFTPEAA